MLRTLRSRLILSHILPLIIVVPILYVALVYMLETRFLVPRLTQDLLGDARLLAEITRAQFLGFGSPRDFQFILLRLNLNPALRVVFLDPEGTILYSNDPQYLYRSGEQVQIPGLAQAQAGDEVVLTDYSFLTGNRYSIHTLLPVLGIRDDITAILWITYYEASITQLFYQMRSLTILATLACLLLGTILGSILAVNISRPVQRVTQSINSLARGEHSEQLPIQGSEEIRDLTRSINVLVDRLQSLERARRQLLANLVHELGRPLGALRSAIQALAKGAGQDPKLLDELTTGMDEETARLQNILDELAHLHDQVLGSLELNREEVNLSAWLPIVLLPWAEAAAEKRIEWQTEIPSDLPSVQVDRIRFAQIIGNLVSNAIKYTPTGKSVTINASRQAKEIWIRINDTGPGISPEEQDDIFIPFYRGNQGRRIKQGMGLGLSIARDLIEAHGGRIDIDSTPGFGSSFTVRLPYSA